MNKKELKALPDQSTEELGLKPLNYVLIVFETQNLPDQSTEELGLKRAFAHINQPNFSYFQTNPLKN